MLNSLRNLVLALALLLLWLVQANAATCFWVGGAGTWDNAADAAHWSSSSGGSGSTCAATGGFPKNAGDVATFDASSGGGTVTNNVALNIGQITMGAFTGTLTWATNNQNVTIATWSNAGTGTRTFSMGNGTWTITGVNGNIWDQSTATNLTFNSNSSTMLVQGSGTPGSARTLALNALTYNAITINEPTEATNKFPLQTTGAATITTLTITNAYWLEFAGAATVTITNAFSWINTLATPGLLKSQSTNNGTTLSVGGAVTLNGVAIQNTTKAGAGSITCTNCLDLGGNSGVTITTPAGGGRIIGG